MLIVKRNLKKILPEGMRLSSDFPEALEKRVQELIIKAVERAKANHRTTVMVQDL